MEHAKTPRQKNSIFQGLEGSTRSKGLAGYRLAGALACLSPLCAQAEHDVRVAPSRLLPTVGRRGSVLRVIAH